METNNIINIPEGFEIDKEQSTERQIVLRKIEDKRVNSWQEYCKLMKGKDSCFVDMNGNIRTTNFSSTAAVGEFEDMEDAMAFAALHKLISLRKNWVGDWKPDWESDESKYTIINEGNLFVSSLNVAVSSPMSFPTEEMSDEFLATFKDLLEQAKSLL